MPTRDIVVPNQGESYQLDACHGFLLLIFGTILFPYSSNLIDGALAQVILQVVGGHSYVEAVLAETIRSLDYVRELVSSDNSVIYRISLQRRIAFHTASCGQTRQLHFQTGFYRLGKFDACGTLASFRNFTSRSIPLMMSELSQLLQHMWLSSIRTGSHLFVGYARHEFRRHHKQTFQTSESSIQGAMRTELQSISEERDRLCCELVNTRSELTDHRELQRELAQTRSRVANQDREIARLSATLDRAPTKKRKDTPPTLTHSQTPLTQVTSPPIPADISTAHSGVPIGHSPPTAQTASNLVNPARFTALEGMVNHLATNMATNMTELMAMLRNQNQASSSFTPPPEHRPIVDPNPAVPPTFVSEIEDASFLVMAYTLTVHPINDPLPPPPAPTAVSLPPATLLSADSTMHTLLPLTVSMHPPIYTVPPPIVPPRKMLSYWDYEEFVIQTFQDSLTGSALDWFMTLKAGDVPTWTVLSPKFLDQYRFCAKTPPTLLDLSKIEMREGQAFEVYATEWRGKAAKHIPPITERQQVQLFHTMLRGAYYSHLLPHTSSFSDLIEA
ncbi:hypothetical protein CRG98_020153 [Punica granatum]|uniref:Retrotransposon gag domain-containing protein n=1 Tax=Punica granatum TaxID=22663 RepID=A0A2I0JUB2_PUNGR|nr:hypothetical protein CRG98_020153 [Punica granatum]